jgi:cbb3-type cytochrome oxidase cytochrome c subunit
MAHGLVEQEIDAIVSYLATLGNGLKFKKARHANAERGSALYHEKGCVACHAPTRDFRGPQGSGLKLTSALAVPLPDLGQKTTLTALEHFLADPSKFRPDSRMPRILLKNRRPSTLPLICSTTNQAIQDRLLILFPGPKLITKKSPKEDR